MRRLYDDARPDGSPIDHLALGRAAPLRGALKGPLKRDAARNSMLSPAHRAIKRSRFTRTINRGEFATSFSRLQRRDAMRGSLRFNSRVVVVGNVLPPTLWTNSFSFKPRFEHKNYYDKVFPFFATRARALISRS